MAEKKIKLVVALKAFLIVILGMFLAIFLAVYFFPALKNGKAGSIFKKIIVYVPLPIAIVDNQPILMGKLFKQLESVKKFYENQDFSGLGMRVDFSTTDGKKRLSIKEKNILNKLIENKIIEVEAKKRNISLTKDMIDQEVDRKLKEFGTEENLKQDLEKLYGWDMEDFKENIVKPDIWAKKLFEDLKKEDESSILARKKIEEAKRDLEVGKSFREIATKYSEGESAKNGGSLGWFNAAQMLPEVAIETFMLEKGKQSEIIESSIGYHIIEVEDKKEEDGIVSLKINQIFVRIKTLPDWLEEFENKQNIFIFSKEFKWNREEKKLDFREEEMNQYEKDLLEKGTDDPSIMF